MPIGSLSRSISIWWQSKWHERAKKLTISAKKKTSNKTRSGHSIRDRSKIRIQGRPHPTAVILTTNCHRQPIRSSNTLQTWRNNRRSLICNPVSISRSAITRRKVHSFHMSMHSLTKEYTCTQLMKWSETNEAMKLLNLADFYLFGNMDWLLAQTLIN